MKINEIQKQSLIEMTNKQQQRKKMRESQYSRKVMNQLFPKQSFLFIRFFFLHLDIKNVNKNQNYMNTLEITLKICLKFTFVVVVVTFFSCPASNTKNKPPMQSICFCYMFCSKQYLLKIFVKTLVSFFFNSKKTFGIHMLTEYLHISR